MTDKIRSPIVSVLGHVDHGKSSILDVVRSSNILKTEAGAITQAIGASIVPLDIIKKVCGSLLNDLKMDFTIPGLLFIDTPGHAAFTSLRKRGGALADIAIVTIDINEGFKPQTIEAIEILKSSKTPFVIAANKLDLVPNFKLPRDLHSSLLKSISSQEELVVTTIDTRLYNIVGQIHEKFQIEADRFDRVDFTKQVAIVPCSAKRGFGIAELMMVVTGLAQRFLENNLHISTDGFAKATILEVKEEKGFGKTIELILYNGNLKVNDTIVIGSLNGPIVTKVRALLQPLPLQEMRNKKSKFKQEKQVFAATGVKISAPNLDNATSGMPVVSCDNNPEAIDIAKQEVQKEINEVMIETDGAGIVLKADNLGSLEAMIHILQNKDVMIKKATIGNISKKDIIDAEANFEDNPQNCVILAFNSKLDTDYVSEHVKIISSAIIYKILDDYEFYIVEMKKKEEEAKINSLTRPAKIEFLQNCIFRQNNPAVFGIEVLTGVLKTNTYLVNAATGKRIGSIKSIQKNKDSVNKCNQKDRVAISIPHLTIGRQANEGDSFLVDVPESDFRELKKWSKLLSKEEKQILRELAELKRKENPVWGV
jgi:translation initiation factor 5B